MSPKFSIIIPVFNNQDFLSECLESIIAQTYENWEAICVDDGSIDSSFEVLKQYQEKDARIIVIQQANAGVSAARNRGLKALSGEYFLFVDSDDAITPDALEAFEDVLRKGYDALLVHPYDALALNKDELHIGKAEFVGETDCPKDLICGRWNANGLVTSRVYSTKLFSKVEFPVGVAFREDVMYWADALCVNAHWGVITKKYYWYRQHPSSASHHVDPNGCLDLLRCPAFVLDRIKNNMHGSEKEILQYWEVFGKEYRQVANGVFSRWNCYSFEQKQQALSDVRRIRCILPIDPFDQWTKMFEKLSRRHELEFLFPVLAFLRRATTKLIRVLCSG